MSWQNIKEQIPKVAASALAQYVVVKGDTTVDGQAVLAATSSDDCIGVNLATVPSYGLAAQVAVKGVVKLVIAASAGANARVGVASTNGAVGPIIATGAAASGNTARTYSIGILQEARAAGEYGSVYLDPREVI